MDRPGAVSVVRRLLHRRDVRRVELAYAGFISAEFGTWVAILVYAYERGGATGAALAALAQLLPASVAAPLLSGLVDRRGGATVLRLGYLCQAAGFAAVATLILISAPPALVYATAIVTACAVTMTRPAQAALIPSLVRDADELTAINTLSGWSEAISDLAGTALAGALIAIEGPGVAIAWFGLVLIVSAALVATVNPGEPYVTEPEEVSDLRGGLIALREDRGLAGVVAVLGAEYLVIGVLDVLLVVLAIGVLEMGESGAGYLSAAFGAGGILGSVAALSLIGRRRLASPLIAAAVGWAALMVALGAWPTVGGAFLLLAIAGAARTVVEVAGRTMLLRGAPGRGPRPRVRPARGRLDARPGARVAARAGDGRARRGRHGAGRHRRVAEPGDAGDRGARAPGRPLGAGQRSRARRRRPPWSPSRRGRSHPGSQLALFAQVPASPPRCSRSISTSIPSSTRSSPKSNSWSMSSSSSSAPDAIARCSAGKSDSSVSCDSIVP